MRPHIAPTAFLIGTFFRGCDLQGGGFLLKGFMNSELISGLKKAIYCVGLWARVHLHTLFLFFPCMFRQGAMH
jgi:hypothetical protein